MVAQTGSLKKNNPINSVIKAIFKSPEKIIAPIVALFILLVIWQILASPQDVNLPTPIEVIQDTWDPYIIHPFFENGGDKGLLRNILGSLGRVAIGFSLSAVVGVALGILIGSNKLFYFALDPIFQVLRTIPPLAWLPISLAAMRNNDLSAIFVVFITAIWPIIINTTVGVQQIPQDYRNVSRVLHLSKTTFFFNILIPSTLPYIFTGLKIGIGLSWLAIVAAEMLIGVGIGYFIWDSYSTTFISGIIIALVYVGIVGLLLDRLVSFIGSLVVADEQK